MEEKFFRPWVNDEKQVNFVKPKALKPWTAVIEQLKDIKIPKELRCSFCEAIFLNLNHLTAHVRKHTGERPFVCEFCDKSFTRKEELTRHCKIHTGEKRFTCYPCRKQFARKDHLKKHTISMHVDKRAKKNGTLRVISYNMQYIHDGVLCTEIISGHSFSRNKKKCFNVEDDLSDSEFL